MKSEKQGVKSRIGEVKAEIVKLKGANDELLRQGQELQQKLANNNTEILRFEGGLAELERQLKDK